MYLRVLNKRTCSLIYFQKKNLYGIISCAFIRYRNSPHNAISIYAISICAPFQLVLMNFIGARIPDFRVLSRARRALKNNFTGSASPGKYFHGLGEPRKPICAYFQGLFAPQSAHEALCYIFFCWICY